VNAAIQFRSAVQPSQYEPITCILPFSLTDQGSAHPPSGHSVSKSSFRLSTRVRSGCFSHFTGRPSNRLLASPSCLNNGVHTSFPFRLFMKVLALPMTMSPLRARESKTLSLSLSAMNPISPDSLLRVRLAITISLSSPW